MSKDPYQGKKYVDVDWIIGLVAYKGEGYELRLKPRIKTAGGLEAMANSLQELGRLLAQDFKHSGSWGCRVCGEPARRTSNLFLGPLPPGDGIPRTIATLVVHCTCDMEGPCGKTVRSLLAAQSKETNLPYHDYETEITQKFGRSGNVHPMEAASCAGCDFRNEKREDARAMKKCASCKVTRYCSKACQKYDWPRHKKFCSIFESITWPQTAEEFDYRLKHTLITPASLDRAMMGN